MSCFNCFRHRRPATDNTAKETLKEEKESIIFESNNPAYKDSDSSIAMKDSDSSIAMISSPKGSPKGFPPQIPTDMIMGFPSSSSLHLLAPNIPHESAESTVMSPRDLRLREMKLKRENIKREEEALVMSTLDSLDAFLSS